MKVLSLFSWLLANKESLAGALLGLIGCASLLIKALEGLVKLLVTLFPKLQTADGGLLHAAAWLDALSKSGWLNTMAASPASAKVAPAPPKGVPA